MNKKDILDYIMNTPHNTNWAVLKSLVGDNEELYKYITETSYNMNRAVLSGILSKNENEESKLVLLFEETIGAYDDDDGELPYYTGVSQQVIELNYENIIVEYNEDIYELVRKENEFNGNVVSYYYGSTLDNNNFIDYPFRLQTNPHSNVLVLQTKESGNYDIKIYAVSTPKDDDESIDDESVEGK